MVSDDIKVKVFSYSESEATMALAVRKASKKTSTKKKKLVAKRRVSELAVAIPINATQFVYSVLRETLPTARLTPNTKLSDLGFDIPSLDGLASRINVHRWHGVFVDNPTIEGCTTIKDVINAVTRAEK